MLRRAGPPLLLQADMMPPCMAPIQVHCCRDPSSAPAPAIEPLHLVLQPGPLHSLPALS